MFESYAVNVFLFFIFQLLYYILIELFFKPCFTSLVMMGVQQFIYVYTKFSFFNEFACIFSVY